MKNDDCNIGTINSHVPAYNLVFRSISCVVVYSIAFGCAICCAVDQSVILTPILINGHESKFVVDIVSGYE